MIANNLHVHTEPSAVQGRLEQLRLTAVALRESIIQAHLQRALLTRNHPPTFPGLAMWGYAVGALGDQLRPLGWVRINEGNYPLTVNEELGIAVAVASADENTGNPHEHPSNRSKKGRSTVDAVKLNHTFDLFADLMPSTAPEIDGRETWVLLHHTDVAKKEIRMELSRPSEIGKDGKFSNWSERIMLERILFDDDLTEILPPDGPDFEIEIRRKAS